MALYIFLRYCRINKRWIEIRYIDIKKTIIQNDERFLYNGALDFIDSAFERDSSDEGHDTHWKKASCFPKKKKKTEMNKKISENVRSSFEAEGGSIDTRG